MQKNRSLLEDQNQDCMINAVTVCRKLCCLVSKVEGGRDDLMPQGSRTWSWRLNCMYHCFCYVAWKISAPIDTLWFGKVLRS